MIAKKQDIIAVVPSAGMGKRFGSNKPFVLLNSKPLFIYSLEIFEALKSIKEIIPIMKPEDMELALRLIEEAGIKKVKKIAPGGKERQDSVYNGLKFIENKDSIIIIHDAVRPIINIEMVESALKQLKRFDGVVLAVPPKDTIKESSGMIVNRTLKRENLWAVQTPQIFPYKIIMDAYINAMKAKYYSTDDSALVEFNGGKIKIVMGSYKNIKVTTPEDISIAEIFLRQSEVK
ncbi:TPA: 2-C-methyl-D-erythritol 4-phosphate cytidylyltransferase [bacterium]|nr:2-C-methyl-D-erythritol 4-phosphate cytidylyltransferase [bacterium]